MKTYVKHLCLLCSFIFFFSCKKDEKASPNTVKDKDGNVYKTVKIGNQVWMAENLKTTKLNDGTPISFVTDNATWANFTITDPMFCYYDNKPEKFDQYGALYNWYAASNAKLAPQGWHVATGKDWQELQDYLIANGYNYDGSTSENKTAKSLAAASGWLEDSTVGNVGKDQVNNNKSGFNALAGGGRAANGSFSLEQSNAYWWQPSAANADEGNYLTIYSSSSSPSGGSMSKRVGLYVRCVKD